MAAHLFNDIGSNRRSLNQFHFEAQWMLAESLAILGSDIDIDSHNLSWRPARIKAFHDI
jgi:hypothetical protein